MNNRALDSAPKLAVFLPYLAGGGAERSMLTVASEIARRGIKVDLVLARSKGQLLEQAALNSQIRIVNLNCSRVFEAIFPLIRYIRREKPQVILSAMEHANLAVMLARAVCGLSDSSKPRLAISIHGMLSVSGLKARIKAGLQNYLTAIFQSQAEVIIAVSTGMANYYIEKFKLKDDARLQVVHNPALRPEIHQLAELQPDHPWLINKSKPVIISVGRLVELKNFADLIRAFQLVKTELDCRLIILGEGDQRLKLNHLIERLGLSASVSLVGFKPNPYPWLKNSDLFVSCSEYESFGMAMIEAMALGTPVLSVDSPGGGPAEILENGRWGKLIPPGDFELLGFEIIRALNELSRNQGLQRAKEFSAESIIDIYLKLLKF